MPKRIDLHSPHTPEAVARKLQAIMDAPQRVNTTGVMGHGSQYDMRLFYSRYGQSNSFAPQLKAKMKPDRGGTRITGWLGTPIGAHLFMVFWVGFLLIFMLVGGGIALAGEGGFTLFSSAFIFMPLLMLVFGVWMWFHGRKISRGDGAVILEFLKKELGAKSTKPDQRL